MNLRRIWQIFQKTAESSWKYFVSNPLVQDITFLDFGMQVTSAIFWNLYLIYTAIRCLILVMKFIIASSCADIMKQQAQKMNIWKQAQLYSSTKVLGIFTSQTVMIAIGASPLSWGICVFAWGVFLAALSASAYLMSVPSHTV